MTIVILVASASAALLYCTVYFVCSMRSVEFAPLRVIHLALFEMSCDRDVACHV